MTFILTLRKDMQLIRISSNQRLFFLPAPTLNLFLSIKCLINAIVDFAVNQLDRQPLGRVVCAQAMLVLPQPPFQIPRTARVETAISTFKDIGIGHRFYSIKVRFGSAQRTAIRSTNGNPLNERQSAQRTAICSTNGNPLNERQSAQRTAIRSTNGNPLNERQSAQRTAIRSTNGNPLNEQQIAS
jgi:hypothetical protein